MSQQLPVTSFAILGLLTLDGPTESARGLTGYELKQRADSTMRFYWTAPAMSQIYSEVSRLAEHGLVEALAGDDGGRRTTRYAITDRGREALSQWLTTSDVGFPVLKHPVALRLMVAGLAGFEVSREWVTDYLADLEAARADLQGVRDFLAAADQPGDTFFHPSLVADWGLSFFDNERRIARRTLARLDEEEDGRGAQP